MQRVREMLQAAALGVLVIVGSAAAEEVEFTTYYPAPFGVYDTLVAERLVDYNAGTYTVPPVVGTDWFLDPATTSVSATLQGRVGIGTNAPLAGIKVDVTGTDTVGLRYVKTGAKDARLMISDPTQAWSLASGWGGAGDFSIIEETVAGDRLYIQKGTGNVGLGTSAPAQRLVAVGDIVAHRSPGTWDFAHLITTDPNIGLVLRSGTTHGTPYIDFANHDPGVGPADMRLILTGDNNLNIQGGTLDVGTNLTGAVNADLRLGQGRNVAAWDYWVDAIDKWVSQIGDANQGGDGDWQLGSSGRMWNLNSGNVGIGTSSPAYKLDVNGTARVNSAATFNSNVSLTNSILTVNGPAGSDLINVGGKARINGDFSAGNTTVNGNLDVGGSIEAGGINHTGSSCYNRAWGNRCNQGDVVFGTYNGGSICCRPGN